MPEPTEDKLLKKDIVDLLFNEYSLLKSEVNIHIANYKRHSRNVQVVAAAIFAAGAYMSEHTTFQPDDKNIVLWLSGLLLAILLIHYLVYDIFESIYEMNTIGERMSQLELQINEIAERNLLIWETEIVERMHSLPGVLACPPTVMLWIYVCLLLPTVFIIFFCIGYILLYIPLSTYVGLKRALAIFDLVILVLSVLTLPYVAHGVLTMRPKVRAMMVEAMRQVASSEKHRGADRDAP